MHTYRKMYRIFIKRCVYIQFVVASHRSVILILRTSVQVIFKLYLLAPIPTPPIAKAVRATFARAVETFLFCVLPLLSRFKSFENSKRDKGKEIC